MTTINRTITSLALAFILSVCSIPVAARSDDSTTRQEPVRLMAIAAGPVGVAESSGAVIINGRTLHGGQLIWGGEMLEATDANIRVSLAPFVKVSLNRHSIARLAIVPATFKDKTIGSVLVASLIRGGISVTLNDSTGAYVEAAGSSVAASRGASFSVAASEGIVSIDRIKGEVQQTPAAGRKYKIRPVASGASISVRARSARQIQVQVTDENDNPVPDAPVIFLLSNPGAGTLGSGAGASATVTTNSQGIASVNFSAGAASASTSVTATVAGTSATWTGAISTSAAAGILSGTVLGIIAAAATAGVVTTVVATRSGETSQEPITALPPNIRPRP